jgi:hypothetical protein
MLEREDLWIRQEQVEEKYRQTLERMHMITFNACATAALPLNSIPFQDETPSGERQNEETAQKKTCGKRLQQENTQEETMQVENTQDKSAQAENTQQNKSPRKNKPEERLQAEIKQRMEDDEDAEK